jgi:di/tricarboxylate transporter
MSGPERRVRELAADEDVSILGTIDYERPRYRRAALAVAIFAVTIIVAGTRVTSPAVAGLTGMLVMIATGCVSPRTAFRVDWRVVIMIGALLTLGHAMENSGAGEFLAKGIPPIASWVGPRGVLVALMLATVALSIPMSNQAAALIMLPVGVHAAMTMGIAPRTFAIGICLSASCTFLTPLEPSAALVYGPGRYRFSDFLRVGGPLTGLMLAVLAVGVPMVWPFTEGSYPLSSSACSCRAISSKASAECAYEPPARISAATQMASMICSGVAPLESAARVCPRMQ